jgi:hypothetical protein
MRGAHNLRRPHGGDEEHSWADCYGRPIKVPLLVPGLSLADLAVLLRDVGWDVRSLPADWAADEDMLVVAKESA